MSNTEQRPHKGGRPLKVGLDYFPIDLDIEDDDRIAIVEARYGVVAFGILIKLLIRIYKNGYYAPWTDEGQTRFLRRVPHITLDQLQEIVCAYINTGFFHPMLAQTQQILTSHGIQKRYVLACERRKRVYLQANYNLLDIGHEAFSTDNVIINPSSCSANPSLGDITSPQLPLRDTETPQSKGKEIETESKVKEMEDLVCSRISQLCEQHLPGMITPKIADRIRQASERFPMSWVDAAFREAVETNKRSWGWIEWKLGFWEQNGFNGKKPTETDEQRRARLQAARRQGPR